MDLFFAVLQTIVQATNHSSGAVTSCHKAVAMICTSSERSKQNLDVHPAWI